MHFQQPRVYSLCIYILYNNQLFVCGITILNLLKLNFNMIQNIVDEYFIHVRQTIL